MANCPSDDALLALLRDATSEDAAGVRTHLAQCPRCRKIAGILAQVPSHSGSAESSRSAAGSGESADPHEPPWQPPAKVHEFSLGRRLGLGGMSIVFEGQDRTLDRKVALKFLLPTDNQSMAQRRLLTEAKAAARLQHRNVAVVYRVGEIDGHPFIVQELLQGQTLHRLPRPMSTATVLDIGRQLAAGLARAHTDGILHRDITHANVMVLTDGTVKLLDFGLAKILDAAGPDVAHAAPEMDRGAADGQLPTATRTGALVGTAPYIAPEIWQGAAATTESDIYSVGCVLYELYFSQMPHQAPSLPELAHKVCNVDATVPDLAAAERAPEFVSIIMRCVCRSPAGRYRSAGELSAALEQLAAAASPEAAPGQPTSPRSRLRWPVLTGAALAVLCVLAAGYKLTREPDPPPRLGAPVSQPGAPALPPGSPHAVPKGAGKTTSGPTVTTSQPAKRGPASPLRLASASARPRPVEKIPSPSRHGSLPDTPPPPVAVENAAAGRRGAVPPHPSAPGYLEPTDDDYPR